MTGSIPTRELGSVAEIVMGLSPPGATYNTSGVGIPLLNGPTEFEGASPVVTLFTTDPRRIAKAGDILFCVRGSTTGRMNWADREYAIGRGVAAIRASEVASTRYLRACISVQLPALLQRAGGSTFPNLSFRDLSTFAVPFPPLPTQRKITAILGAYEDLIENNNRRIKLLEEMAQRIYGEWFVDFRYPGHENVRLVDSEVGRLPEHWEVRTTADLISDAALDIGDGYRAKSTEFGVEGLPFIRIRDLGEDLDFTNVDVLPVDALPRFRQKVSQSGDSVISTKGTVGRVIHISDRTPRFVYSPQLSYWRRLNDTISPSYLRAWLEGPDFERQCAHVKGATDMADYVNLKDQRHMLMVLPPQHVQGAFEAAVSPVRNLADCLRFSCRNLRLTRDLLLPRLISGDIDVTDLHVAVPDLAA